MKYITVLEIFPSFTAIFAPLHTVDALYDHKTGNESPCGPNHPCEN